MLHPPVRCLCPSEQSSKWCRNRERCRDCSVLCVTAVLLQPAWARAPSVLLCVCWLWSWMSCTALALHEAFLIQPGLLSQNWPRYKLQCAACCNRLLRPLSGGIIVSRHHSWPLKGRRNEVCSKCCSWKCSLWKARLYMHLKALSLSRLASRSV